MRGDRHDYRRQRYDGHEHGRHRYDWGCAATAGTSNAGGLTAAIRSRIVRTDRTRLGFEQGADAARVRDQYGQDGDQEGSTHRVDDLPGFLRERSMLEPHAGSNRDQNDCKDAVQG